MSKLVAIDAGHGMKTPGKRTAPLKEDLVINGKAVRGKGHIIHENEWNRAVSKYLAEALERCGINHYFTADVTGTTDTPLNTRAAKANNRDCDILISNHYNAYGGCEKFLDRKGGLLVEVTKNCSESSKKLAKLVHAELAKDIDYKQDYGVGRDVDISGFTLAILRQTKMPAILIEYGFMDVEREAKLMLNPTHQKKCAEATCKGICKYFGIEYKVPVAFEPFFVRTLTTLNVREAASIKAKAKDKKVLPNMEYKVTKVENGWGYIPFRDGWISLNKKYVKKIDRK